MPLQNKVDPFGAIHAVSMRGNLMGNRGCLHNEHKQLIRQRTSYRAWVSCVLEFKGIRQELMAPNSYTQLFFLDEATALSAGHRPCNTCRRPAAVEFAAAWHKAYDFSPNRKVLVKDMDEALQRDRLLVDSARLGRFDDLPHGAMFSMQDEATACYLKHEAGVFRWSFGGYEKTDIALTEVVIARTPLCVLPVLRAGYSPQIHASLAP